MHHEVFDVKHWHSAITYLELQERRYYSPVCLPNNTSITHGHYLWLYNIRTCNISNIKWNNCQLSFLSECIIRFTLLSRYYLSNIFFMFTAWSLMACLSLTSCNHKLHQWFVTTAPHPLGIAGTLTSSSKSLQEAPHCGNKQLDKPQLFDPTLLYYFYPRYFGAKSPHAFTSRHCGDDEKVKSWHMFPAIPQGVWRGGGAWTQMTTAGSDYGTYHIGDQRRLRRAVRSLKEWK